MTDTTDERTGGPSESEAIAALQRLGLSNYEAKVFVALEKLGRGTARAIAEATDVPRSQVYGAAEKLEEQGLVDVQRTKPKQFRPVSLEEARQILRRRREREEERAFEYLESVERERPETEERQEDIWTVHGREAVTDRVTTLAGSATESIVYGASERSHDETLRDVFVRAAGEGVPTLVVSTDRTVLDAFGSTAVETISLPEELGPDDWPAARMIVVDEDTVLISVQASDVEGANETAFWSEETRFADVLIQLIDGWFGEAIRL